jgi:hypothetical protein
MTYEEMQKTMQFILEQEAKTDVRLEVLAERIEGLAVSQERNEKKWERTESGIRTLLAIAEIHEREISKLGETTETLSREILNLSETTRNTDERLNALINIVERDISERRNGRS